MKLASLFWGNLYLFLKKTKDIKRQWGSFLQIHYLRKKGQKIGKNVCLGRESRVSLSKGAKLEIADNVVIDDHCHLIVHPGATLTVGKNCYIGRHNIISALSEVSIGEDCLFAHNVTILDSGHSFSGDTEIRRQKKLSAPVHIGRNVWLATNAVVLKGVSLGDKTVVGANSVVNKSTEGNVVVGGVPFKSLRGC